MRQGGPEYTDQHPTVGCAKDEWSARITIGSVVVVREGHSGRGAGRHTGAVLGILGPNDAQFWLRVRPRAVTADDRLVGQLTAARARVTNL